MPSLFLYWFLPYFTINFHVVTFPHFWSTIISSVHCLFPSHFLCIIFLWCDMSPMSHLMSLYLFLIIKLHCLTLVTDSYINLPVPMFQTTLQKYNLIFNYHFLLLFDFPRIVPTPILGEYQYLSKVLNPLYRYYFSLVSVLCTLQDSLVICCSSVPY